MKAFLEGREHMKLDDGDMRTEETARKSWISTKLRVNKCKAGVVGEGDRVRSEKSLEQLIKITVFGTAEPMRHLPPYPPCLQIS